MLWQLHDCYTFSKTHQTVHLKWVSFSYENQTLIKILKILLHPNYKHFKNKIELKISPIKLNLKFILLNIGKNSLKCIILLNE